MVGLVHRKSAIERVSGTDRANDCGPVQTRPLRSPGVPTLLLDASKGWNELSPSCSCILELLSEVLSGARAAGATVYCNLQLRSGEGDHSALYSCRYRMFILDLFKKCFISLICYHAFDTFLHTDLFLERERKFVCMCVY